MWACAVGVGGDLREGGEEGGEVWTAGIVVEGFGRIGGVFSCGLVNLWKQG